MFGRKQSVSEASAQSSQNLYWFGLELEKKTDSKIEKAMDRMNYELQYTNCLISDLDRKLESLETPMPETRKDDEEEEPEHEETPEEMAAKFTWKKKGEVKAGIRKLLKEHPDWPSKEIASKAETSVRYVNRLRKRMSL